MKNLLLNILVALFLTASTIASCIMGDPIASAFSGFVLGMLVVVTISKQLEIKRDKQAAAWFLERRKQLHELHEYSNAMQQALFRQAQAPQRELTDEELIQQERFEELAERMKKRKQC